MKTTHIRISEKVKSELDKRKLVPMESYDNILKRILKIKEEKK